MNKSFLWMCVAAVAAVGCGDDGTPNGAAGTGGGAAGAGGAATQSSLSVAFTNLPALGADFVYEGWLITGSGPVSAGRFTVSDTGALSDDTFTVGSNDLAVATDYVLTIEPAVGDEPEPTDTHILAGELVNDEATLSISHPAAIGDDFTGATGEYILAVPTAAPNTASFRNGIWWLIPGDPDVAGLSLPTLPAGWEYEGWVVDSGGPVSTGRFTAVSAADADGAGPEAGPQPAPMYPGQDFVTSLRDLASGHTAVISVEPEPDDSPAPFILKPLVHAIGEVMPPTTQAMDNNAAATTPSGTVSATP